MILKNLVRRFTRSILTILGIAIGVAAVVSLGAMAEGIATNYTNAVGLNNDLLVTQANAYDVVFSSLDEDLGQRIQSVPDVSNVDAGVFGWIAFDEMPFFLIFGYEPTSVAIQHYRIVDGKPITGPRQIVIGARAAEALNKGVDDDLRIYGAPYKIVGIYETGQGMEESGGVVTLEDAQAITQKQRQVSLFQVGLRRGAIPAQVIQRIENLDDELTVSLSSEYEGMEEWTAMLQGFAWGIAGIAILIGGLGMMSAMVMSVLERTREIGTLRAVGWTRWRVLRMVMGESILLSLTGGLLGVGIGVLLAWLAGRLPGVGAFLEGSFTPSIIAQGMVTALLLGLIGGAYPAWTAANLQPVEALRYEGGGATDGDGWLTHIGSQSFRNLWRRRTRTLLSAGGIGIGVATLVMLGGLIDGMVGQLNGLAGAGEAGDLTLMQRDVADMSLSSLDERLVPQIQAMPQVKSVSPFMLGVISNEELPLFIVSGLDPNSAAMDHYKLSQGRRTDQQLAVTWSGVEAAEVDVDAVRSRGPSTEANLQAAMAQQASANAALDNLLAGATREEIAMAEAHVQSARAALSTAEAQLRQCQIVAPYAGQVGAVNVRMGEMVTSGQPLLLFGDARQMHVETTDLRETDVVRLVMEMPVEVTFDALPDEVFDGTITRIAPVSSTDKGSTNYTVQINLDKLDERLRWGMTAFVNIQAPK